MRPDLAAPQPLTDEQCVCGLSAREWVNRGGGKQRDKPANGMSVTVGAWRQHKCLCNSEAKKLDEA